jgi:molybdate transport system regulatory protein
VTDEGVPNAAVHIESDGVVFDARDATLLRAVDEHGSLNAAATALGRSFAHAQRRVVELEEAFGSLVERRRGGAGGGGSELTDGARALLARFDRLRSEFTGVADATLSVFLGEVRAREGELAVIDAAPGRVLALTPGCVGIGAPVEVSVRADAITVELPEEAPAPDATSARNRFEGRVSEVVHGESVGRVAVDVTAEPTLETSGSDEASGASNTTLWALLTADSIDRMGLETGDRVVVSFKATATRALPR